jgi:hypothetical protein
MNMRFDHHQSPSKNQILACIARLAFYTALLLAAGILLCKTIIETLHFP